MHNSQSSAIRGQWVRWSKYELLEGTVFPARDAQLEEYDPWQEFNANIGKYRTVQQPYVALLELNRRLEAARRTFKTTMQDRQLHPVVAPSQVLLPSNITTVLLTDDLRTKALVAPLDFVIEPDSDAAHLVLDWCRRIGLLGLVPILSVCIQIGEYEAHIRRGSEWDSTDFVVDPPTNPHARDLDWCWWSLMGRAETILPAQVKDYFLPALVGASDKVLPCPRSEPFWRSYGEPILNIVRWCEAFGLSVDALSELAPGSGELSSQVAEDAFKVLSRLADSCSPSFTFDSAKRTITEERVSAGLLASYAQMFLWDRVAGRRAIRCHNCGSYFVSDEHRARYCSPTCRNTAQSRRYRKHRMYM
jgi:hypothetical protein